MNDLAERVLPNVSIVICTYNRAESLMETLHSLADQKNTGLRKLEVIVIDNNSTDDTPATVELFAEHLPIRRCIEPKQGLSNARNRGIVESRGGVVIFIDDDVRLAEGWLSAYLDAFDNFPHAGFFGGRILPDWTTCPRPRWLKDETLALLRGVLGELDFGVATRPYRDGDGDDGPSGASFAVRRALFKELGDFRSDLGVVGTSRGRGEETEFFLRARRQGATGVYVGRALCRHRVDPTQLTLRALYQYGIESGVAHKRIVDHTATGAVFKAAGFVLKGLRQLALGRGDRFRQCIINAGIQVGLKK